MPEDTVCFCDYNDICGDCEEAQKCHKNGIDYDKVAQCKKEIQKLLDSVKCQ